MKVATGIFAALLCVDTAFILALSPFTLGSLIMICLSAFFCALFFGWKFFEKATSEGAGKVLKGVFQLCLGVVLAFCGILLMAGRTDAGPGRQVVIVPGAGTGADGSPTRRGKARVEARAEYFSENPETKILVCGGFTGKSGVSEARAMEKYLVSLGVPRDSIIKEESSMNTRQNFSRAYDILSREKADIGRVVLVTSDFHVSRAKYYAGLAGFKNTEAIAVPTDIFLLPPSLLREMCAVAAAFFLGY